MARADQVHVVGLHRFARLVFGEQHFVQFLSGADADVIDFRFGRDGLRQIGDLHAGDLGHEDLATLHALDATNDEPDALVEREPEARHALVSNREAFVLRLFQENRDDAAAAADDIAIARTADTRTVFAGI